MLVCRLMGAQDTHVDTSTCGTPSHAAPEVLAHGRLTKQGEVFAFGIMGECCCSSPGSTSAGLRAGGSGLVWMDVVGLLQLPVWPVVLDAPSLSLAKPWPCVSRCLGQSLCIQPVTGVCSHCVAAAVVWELVAGEEPYRGMLAVQIILQVAQQGYRPPGPPTCPPALRDLMERCWSQDPAAR